MRYIHDTTDFKIEGHASLLGAAVTLGKFDGLHRGHQRLLHKILQLQSEGYYGIVFTIAPEDKPSLLTPAEKQHILEAYGIDCMIRCPFVPDVLGMEPETFISEVLCRQLNARYIIVGSDFRFGYKRSGDVDFLKRMQYKYGYKLLVVRKECHNNQEISSTWIREALSDADMELVRALMGNWFSVEGTVLHGRHLGHQIGMPTINLRPDPYKLLPPSGVYYSDVEISGENKNIIGNPVPDKNSCVVHGITNIGYKPTVDGSFLGVETYLYGTKENLYGRNVRVFLRHFRRPEQKFSSLEELKAQMNRDVISGKEYFSVK